MPVHTHGVFVCMYLGVCLGMHIQIKNEGYPIIFAVQCILKTMLWIEELTHTSATRMTTLKLISMRQVFTGAGIFTQALRSSSAPEQPARSTKATYLSLLTLA